MAIRQPGSSNPGAVARPNRRGLMGVRRRIKHPMFRAFLRETA